jgi:hypothetical protein
MGTDLTNSSYATEVISFISPLAFFLSRDRQHLDPFLQSQGFQHLLGHHFFNLTTPVFALDQLSMTPYPVAQVAKQDEVEAPSSIFPGAAARENVKWLFLQDSKRISQGGIDTVYRIETVGGTQPATCKGQNPSFEVNYVAQC